MRPLGETATDLPWLCPCADALSVLAQAPADAWEQVRGDPAAVLLVVRQTAAALAVPSFSSLRTLVHHPAVLKGALGYLEAGSAGFADWSAPPLRPVHAAGLCAARLAHSLAQRSGLGDPENAWAAALLAPLGWYAVAALAPEQVAACLEDPAHPRHPDDTERRHWGLDSAALARRLAQKWGLPRWLAAAIGHLSLPVETAARLGADPDSFRVVQLAVGLTQQPWRQASRLSLPVRLPSAEALAGVGLSAEEAEAPLRAAVEPVPSFRGEAPTRVPLLPTVLALAAENRRLKAVPAVADLQRDLDELHRALEAQLAHEAEYLRTQKLNALAEFAAGAGHEINNPLAVISGQAQYLLKKIADCRLQIADCSDKSAICNLQSVMERPLHTIIQQTKRIHQILTELMQFARPPRPHPEAVAVADLVREVTAGLQEAAAQGQVELRCPEPPERCFIQADPQQARTALACLLRNAVESAPAGGWAAVRVEADAEFVELIVEDNGSGPTPGQREHLFDPFYSGRHAGRGRGLGLPTAWRLAREHGGNVRFECRAGSPTRFVLSLPRSPERNGNGKPHNAAIPEVAG